MIRAAGATDITDIRALMNTVAGFWDKTWRPDVLERVLGSQETIALVHQDAQVIDGFALDCARDVGFPGT